MHLTQHSAIDMRRSWTFGLLFLLLTSITAEGKKHRKRKQCPVSSPPSTNSTDLQGFLSLNGVGFGLLPDEGVDGGGADSLTQIESWTKNLKPYTFGWYAQVKAGDTSWDGSQLTQVTSALKQSGAAVFEAAVMPQGGFDGSVADSVCGVLKKIQSESGVSEVRLRYGHEVNWYVTDGTYSGTASEYKAAWKAVAASCQPTIKMFYSPNIANVDAYEEWAPDDASTVDYVGVDYYPRSSDELSASSYAEKMQAFHDKYTGKDDAAWSHVKFAFGETAYSGGSSDDKLKWAQAICESKAQLTNLVSVSWFNYVKGSDMRIVSDATSGAALANLLDGSTSSVDSSTSKVVNTSTTPDDGDEGSDSGSGSGQEGSSSGSGSGQERRAVSSSARDRLRMGRSLLAEFGPVDVGPHLTALSSNTSVSGSDRSRSRWLSLPLDAQSPRMKRRRPPN